ncbi:GTP-binding protein [Fictibacillus sp. Mic-4]|uniref:CobW family GTP-binding protein n=1 Tax=Fictibacillus sp. Mic-4 TaxID=3132826 RepID=UPI003CF0426D
MKMRKIPVFILTGFLGSGKTTVMLNMLQHCKSMNATPGIVLNELGQANVESHLFQREKMVELLDGCICCTVKENLIEELALFLKKENEVDVLLIEGTGIANPKEIVEALKDPALMDRFEIQSIIGIVDCSKFLEYGSIFSSSKEIRDLLDEQLSASTLIILNKTDLVSEKVKGKAIKKIQKLLQGQTKTIETAFGKVDMDTVFKKWAGSFTVPAPDQANSPHHKEGHHHPFQAIKMENVPAIERASIEKWLHALPENVVRGKGIVRLKREGGLFQFQYASGRSHFTRLACEEKRETCIIMIGHRLPVKEMKESFRRLVLKTASS